jgi:hypothetical protein
VGEGHGEEQASVGVRDGGAVGQDLDVVGAIAVQTLWGQKASGEPWDMENVAEHDRWVTASVGDGESSLAHDGKA